VPRLQSAVARVLPAIEATLARLAAGPQAPREMEQTARALNTMMRTLRELNALLAQQQARPIPYDDDTPEDIYARRDRLAQRIDAIFQSLPEDDFSDADAPPAAAAER
jgi:multidrug resistance efflux pump